MPQLNPNPWLMIMIFTWLALLLILMPKTMQHKPTNDIIIHTYLQNLTPWTWPW
uniref:ATP synthase complex subunit 8 n=1 Tax=Chikila fulleri TaxID=928324 RepID=R4H023_CHIFU|nr:ATP synthase F0 subunit 8 [Chikila fulleri]ADR03260.1 ATP synthase F0 subunit 8 [Chikila fulleri]